MIRLTTISSHSAHGEPILDSLIDLATGNGVKRTRHDLEVDGRDYTDEFIRVLQQVGFTPMTIAETPIEPGERVPAFYIKDSTAYFGWIFFEKFTDRRMRKLWGSVIRNEKGDWAIQLSSKKNVTLYVDLKKKLEMDLDRPTNW